MIGLLPDKLEVGGVLYEIRPDFRVVLNIFQAFSDDELDDWDKAEICLKCLFKEVEKIPDTFLEEAINKAFWFCDGGDMPKSKPNQRKTFDWAYDESIIFPAVNKAAGFETRQCDFLHWWTFLGYFNEIDEGFFSTVMHIRSKRAKGKPLEKWERDFYEAHKNLINIVTEEDRKAIEETEEFINSLFGGDE